MKNLISTICLIVASFQSFATWQALGSGVGGRVYALAVHNNELYAGGNFTGLISKWDGATWNTVGGLTGTSVRCLISFNGELYAGGSFNLAGNSGNIARWDGANWVGVGDGLGGVVGSSVLCFKERNGELYAGGTFNQSGVSSVSKIARLVNTAWQQVGGGAPPNCTAGVYAMENYNSQLYVGGQGSAPWINVLDLGGTVWTNLQPNGSLNSGVGVYALGVFRHPIQSTPALFIGGDFSAPFTTCCIYYNSNWSTSVSFFSGGVSDQVNAFLSTSDFIYAGGNFTVNGLATATNISKKRTGLPWDSVGVTVNGAVDAFAIYQGFLVCGGDFTTADGNIVNHVVINDGVFVSSNDLAEPQGPALFPIPAHASIHYSPQSNHDVRQLTIYDACGKQVFETQIEKECDIDLRNLKSGIYFYYISERGIKISEGKIILE